MIPNMFLGKELKNSSSGFSFNRTDNRKDEHNLRIGWRGFFFPKLSRTVFLNSKENVYRRNDIHYCYWSVSDDPIFEHKQLDQITNHVDPTIDWLMIHDWFIHSFIPLDMNRTRRWKVVISLRLIRINYTR